MQSDISLQLDVCYILTFCCNLAFYCIATFCYNLTFSLQSDFCRNRAFCCTPEPERNPFVVTLSPSNTNFPAILALANILLLQSDFLYCLRSFQSHTSCCKRLTVLEENHYFQVLKAASQSSKTGPGSWLKSESRQTHEKLSIATRKKNKFPWFLRPSPCSNVPAITLFPPPLPPPWRRLGLWRKSWNCIIPNDED